MLRKDHACRCRKVSQLEKFVIPIAVNNKTSSKKDALEGIEISYSGKGVSCT
jgi:hypothetical protein